MADLTTLERITLRRKLEKAERVDTLGDHIRAELFRVAERCALSGSAEHIEASYKDVARVARLAFKRGQDFEGKRQWGAVV